MTRTELINRLTRERFQVLIIGGGIVGAGIARDAAMRGLKVALIEQGDFASGTSSKTSKLIHGGLRYLEQGRVRLVRESLRERQILRTIAPALVCPVSVLLPTYEGHRDEPWKIKLGLSLYDLLAWGDPFTSHRMLSRRRVSSLEPGLCVEGLRSVGLYTDCQMDDARLCLANILQAVEFGAVCCNYVRLRTLLSANRKICGAAVEDVWTAKTHEVHSQVVVNAAGPWADRIRQMSQVDAEPRLAPTKGIHLVLPRLVHQGIFSQTQDQRRIFLLPWGNYTLVGTTESAVDGSLDRLAANAKEVDYLLTEVNRILPGSRVGIQEVVASFAGARPLLAFSGSARQASREHRLDQDPQGLISVLGGKYTTYRLMARQAVDWILKMHRWTSERCLTDQVNLMESADAINLDHWKDLTHRTDPELLTKLLTRYGTRAIAILQLIDREPALAKPVCPHHDYLEAEWVHAIAREMACTISDVFIRRTRIAWSSCQGLDALSTIALLLTRYVRNIPQSIDAQVKAYKTELARGLSFRSSAGQSPVFSASTAADSDD